MSDRVDPDIRSDYEQGRYLKQHGREKNQLMRQFLKLESGIGNTPAFRSGWVRAFGRHICGACGERFEWATGALQHLREHAQ